MVEDTVEQKKRIFSELREMDCVYDVQTYPGRRTERPRILVNFHQGVEEMSVDFQDWMRENDLVIAAAHTNTKDAGTTLVIELQFIGNL